jgi:hypothetical protein
MRAKYAGIKMAVEPDFEHLFSWAMTQLWWLRALGQEPPWWD